MPEECSEVNNPSLINPRTCFLINLKGQAVYSRRIPSRTIPITSSRTCWQMRVLRWSTIWIISRRQSPRRVMQKQSSWRSNLINGRFRQELSKRRHHNLRNGSAENELRSIRRGQRSETLVQILDISWRSWRKISWWCWTSCPVDRVHLEAWEDLHRTSQVLQIQKGSRQSKSNWENLKMAK